MKVEYTNIFSSLANREYLLGGYSKEGPLDCFGLVYEFTRRVTGISLPTIFMEYNVSTYPSLYRNNSAYASELLAKYISTFFKKVTRKYLIRGDIILLSETVSKVSFPGIYCGCGAILLSTEKYGVTLMPKDCYNVISIFQIGERICQQLFQL